jgi:hypothetical protein
LVRGDCLFAVAILVLVSLTDGDLKMPLVPPSAVCSARSNTNIVRAFLNDTARIRDGVADPAYGAFGPFALYAGGSGDVRFRNIAFKDLHARVAQPEKVSDRFRIQRLNEFYYSWGPAVADFNRDGSLDIVSVRITTWDRPTPSRGRILAVRPSIRARSISTDCSTGMISPATDGRTS